MLSNMNLQINVCITYPIGVTHLITILNYPLIPIVLVIGAIFSSDLRHGGNLDSIVRINSATYQL